jgi:CBS domain-containing protein
MLDADMKKDRMTVADLVARLEARPLPVISEQASADEVINAFADSIHTRLLYVLDAEGKLVGVISLGRLVRHVLNSYHEPKIHSRHILNMLCSNTAHHLMQKETIFAMLSEDLEEVLQRMINTNVKEVAVLNHEQKVVADLTMVDILKYYKMLDDCGR